MDELKKISSLHIIFCEFTYGKTLRKLLCRTSNFSPEKLLVLQFDLYLSLKLALEKILYSEKNSKIKLSRTNTNKNLLEPGILHFSCTIQMLYRENVWAFLGGRTHLFEK